MQREGADDDWNEAKARHDDDLPNAMKHAPRRRRPSDGAPLDDGKMGNTRACTGATHNTVRPRDFRGIGQPPPVAAIERSVQWRIANRYRPPEPVSLYETFHGRVEFVTTMARHTPSHRSVMPQPHRVARTGVRGTAIARLAIAERRSAPFPRPSCPPHRRGSLLEIV